LNCKSFLFLDLCIVVKVTQNLADLANFMMEFQVMLIVFISIQSIVKL
jgi:hypothetical protein